MRLIFALSLLLAACSQGQPATVQSALAFAAGEAAPALAALQQPAEMQALIAADAPRLILRLPAHQRASTLLLAGERAGVKRWRSADNVQIYTREGLVIGTRGLGFDLMTTSTSPEAAAAITAALPGQLTRLHRLPDGSGALQLQGWICDILPRGSETIRLSEHRSAATLRVEERCHGPDGGFSNHYWLRGGKIVQSWQQISARSRLGQLQLLFLTEAEEI